MAKNSGLINLTLLILVLATILFSCQSNTIKVQTGSFSEPVEKVLSLYLEKLKDRINPERNALHFFIENASGDSIKVRITAISENLKNFQNCSTDYNFVTIFKGYKVYIYDLDQQADLFFKINKDFIIEKIPDNCNDYIPSNYNGCVWFISLVNGKPKSFYYQYVVLPPDFKDTILSMERWY